MQFPIIVNYSENNNATFQDDESIGIVSITFSPETPSVRLFFCCHFDFQENRSHDSLARSFIRNDAELYVR